MNFMLKWIDAMQVLSLVILFIITCMSIILMFFYLIVNELLILAGIVAFLLVSLIIAYIN